ncbi:iron complex transport system ATP-binding protein [Stackebrandtia endophytica]|uniref:Iron complex transport system ATP-binding protein n=1 Tax=Stackebrandtia endophytica TaxID=1496996 RepID=A0A543AS60_9ACTN|nr:ABC transporter ATP-binding protein [Stackebrandtia endophytica]TQL75423.1 iron complex transport system ATP-binding protein [Stackebrandtia endophytica]
MLDAYDIHHAYGSAPVLRGVSVQASDGEVVGLIGPNGSGKTTLLRTLYGSLTPQRGTVTLDDVPLARFTRPQLARRLAVVVQEQAGEMPLSVADTVLLGRTPHLGTFQRRTDVDTKIAADALARVGATHLASRDFGGLSGGERQRVLIARALAQQAEYLLMDEPTNHLDIHFQHEVLHLVRELGVTTVVVLHDLNLAARYCDRLVLLHEGRAHADGTPEDVLLPTILEEVYRIAIEPVTADDGRLQLLFRHTEAAMPVNDDTLGRVGSPHSPAMKGTS